MFAEALQTVALAARPLRVKGRLRLAGRARRKDWQAALAPSLAGLDARERRRLAQAWLRDALEEHASVASFARLALQLVALGAPPALLRATQRATLDEIAHAELCFGLAGAYAKRAIGPGALHTDNALHEPADRCTVAVAAVREGCVAETIGAMVATAAAARCVDPVVRAVLERIAADETRHAGLAWRYLRWALGRDDRGDIERAVLAAFVVELDRYCATPPPSEEDDTWLARHGRLGERERFLVAAHTLREVVLPCARALVAETRRPNRRVHSEPSVIG
jgi:hypothetical protein